jgi:hypothetical protein
MSVSIYLFHALIIAPLLIYIGYNGNKTSPVLFKLLLVLGIVVLIYHMYLSIKRY